MVMLTNVLHACIRIGIFLHHFASGDFNHLVTSTTVLFVYSSVEQLSVGQAAGTYSKE